MMISAPLRCCVASVGRRIARRSILNATTTKTAATTRLTINASIVRCLSTTTSTSSSTSLLEQRNAAQGPHGKYQDEYQFSITDPEGFWKKAAQAIDWHTEPSVILKPGPTEAPHQYHWFSDGVMNTCYNCLDVHVIQNGRGDQPALIYDSPVTNVQQTFTYSELLDQVATFAAVLQNNLGVETGDRVIIYMPMIPQAVIAMLACARIGAVHSVVFGGFAAKELATRIKDCQPKVIVSASAGVEPTRIVPYKPLLDAALELAGKDSGRHSVEHTVIVQRHNVQSCTLGKLDHDYDELMASVTQPANAVPLPANHPHYILYTSGTTGKLE